MSLRSSFSLRATALSLAISMILPSAALAADPVQIVDTSVKNVTRAQFLDWALKTFDVTAKNKKCTLSYKRLPSRYQSILCAAQEKKALGAFPANTTFTRAIEAGEALQILTVLTGKKDNVDISAYKDVKGVDLTIAVKNAVSNRWLLPVSTSEFGVKRQLSGAQALSILQSATSQYPRETIKIQVNTKPSTSLPTSELLNTVWQLIQRDYIGADKIDRKEASYKLIEGLVQSLGDPYSTFFRPAGADAFQTMLKGEVTGIGAHVELKDGYLTIVTPLPKSPAEKAGLKPGDIILKAGNQDLKNLDVDAAVSFIRGEKGTSVILRVRRGSEEFDVTVVRDLIVIPEVDITWDGDVAVVKLAQFGETTDEKIRSLLTQVQGQDPRGVVLDLRNNPGGLLHAADVVVSAFMPKGTVVAKVKGRTSTTNEITSEEPVIDRNVKVVVLVNAGSASAAEIVAGALQDHKRATVIGTKTFGKGTVQEVLSFASGEALKLTIAEWLTPLGRSIDKVGIVPDVVLTETSVDAQLSRAVNLAR